MKMKALCLAAVLSAMSLISVSSQAAIDYKKIKVSNQCQDNFKSAINFCDEKVLKTVAKLADRKPNFAGNSVVIRFWDKTMPAWRYIAFNKDTNTIHVMHNAVTNWSDNPRSESLKIEGGNQLCSIGNTARFRGTFDGIDYDDSSDKTDVCNPYNPKEGFGQPRLIDQKTRVFVEDLLY